MTVGPFKYYNIKHITPGKSHCKQQQPKTKATAGRPLVEGFLLAPRPLLLCLPILGMLMLMMAGGGGPALVGRDFNYRISPAWPP